MNADIFITLVFVGIVVFILVLGVAVGISSVRNEHEQLARRRTPGR